jgi:hypothetical protein
MLRLMLLFLVALANGGGVVRAEKYYPDHPVVQDMVSKAVAYLSSAERRGLAAAQYPVGVSILIGYTIYKVESDTEHPVVAQSIREAKNFIDSTTSGSQYTNKALYELSLACMLLASVDVESYSPQLIKSRDFFFRVQQANGGFGYIDGSHKATTADISQTQYVMLALWTMSQLGIEVPEDRIVRIVQYLIDSQIRDPSIPAAHGGWPYHWDPTAADNQKVTTHSRVACGLSAILIAGDTLGIYRNRLAQSDEEEDLVPVAFKRIATEEEKPKKGARFDRGRIDNVVDLGLLYNRNNVYSRQSWHYYYLYSLERFESFLEIASGKQNKSPEWYNAEVERLKGLQGKNGSWGGSDGQDFDAVLPPEVSTSLAVLFLIRSTQKAIGDLKEGVVRGWAELPEDISTITTVNGKPVNKTEATSIDDALKMLEDDKKSQGEDKLVADKIVFAKNPDQRKEQLNRFARLLRSRDYQARRVASKVLGRSDDLDVVPELIYALSDPDSTVCRNAETSLRLLSRQLDRYHIPKDGAITEQQRVIAKREWRSWYLSMRPDYIFVE